MEFPDTSLPEPSRANLAWACIEVLSTEEKTHTETADKLSEDSPRRGSLLIGRACTLAQTDWEGAKQALQAIHQDMDRVASAKMSWQHKRIGLIANLLATADSPVAFNEAREHLHYSAGRALRTLRQRKRRSGESHSRKIDTVGILAESRALMVLNRSNHPWAIALPALVQYDSTNNRGFNYRNYDLAHINGAQQDNPLLHKVQIKASCFGHCNRDMRKEERKKRQSYFQKIRQAYGTDIIVASGCCDFSPGVQADTLLLKEIDGQATSENLSTLDAITNHVSLIVSGSDPGRYGLHQERGTEESEEHEQPLSKDASTKKKSTGILAGRRNFRI